MNTMPRAALALAMHMENIKTGQYKVEVCVHMPYPAVDVMVAKHQCQPSSSPELSMAADTDVTKGSRP